MLRERAGPQEFLPSLPGLNLWLSTDHPPLKRWANINPSQLGRSGESPQSRGAITKCVSQSSLSRPNDL